jgi:hypothetical protein
MSTKSIFIFIVFFFLQSTNVFAEEDKSRNVSSKEEATTYSFSWKEAFAFACVGGGIGLCVEGIISGFKTFDDEQSNITATGFLIGAGVGLFADIIRQNYWIPRSQSLVEYSNKNIIFDIPIVGMTETEFNINIFSTKF